MSEKDAHTLGPWPLVEVRRGAVCESRHRGHLAAVARDRRVVARLGSPEAVTYLRSSAKPHQAVPLVASGAADRFRLTDQELAVACGSHNGEPRHVEVVAGILRKIGVDRDALKCGTHEPFGREAARRLRERGEEPTVLHNNCSGKHAGMLALARHLGAPVETYDLVESPVQRMIARTIERFSGVAADRIEVGVDGCGVPTFALPVSAMALMYARFVCPHEDLDEKTRVACGRIVAAMVKHPEMVGGSAARFDTEVMRAARGGLISKVGAEGVYTAGLLASQRWPNGLGLAFKIEDGDDHRARPTVAVEALRQLGALGDEALTVLAPYALFPVHNRRGERVGEVRASFSLGMDPP